MVFFLRLNMIFSDGKYDESSLSHKETPGGSSLFQLIAVHATFQRLQFKSIFGCFVSPRWTEGSANHSRATLHWRSQSSSLCWTTWCLRSSHTSECRHISADPSCTGTNRVGAHILFLSIRQQGILWTRLDEERQKWEDTVHHENDEALQWCTLESAKLFHYASWF